MQFTTTALFTALALLPSTFAAGTAYLTNNCAFPVYYRSNTGASPNKVLTLAPKGVYSEPMDKAASYIQMGRTAGLSAPLTFEFTPSNGLVYYDLSSNAGNPFPSYRNTVTPSVKSCTAFDCKPNDSGCYSKANALKIGACQDSADISVVLCA